MKHSKTFIFLFCLLLAGILFSDRASGQTDSTTADTNAVRPHLQSNTLMLIKLDIARFELPDSEVHGGQLGHLLQQNLAVLKSGIDNNPVFGLIEIPYSYSQPQVRLFVRKSKKSHEFMTNLTQSLDFSKVIETEDFLMASLGWPLIPQLNSSKDTIGQNTPGNLPIPVDRWSAALEQIQHYPIQIAIVPPDYLWKTYEETMTELPEDWGGGAVTRLTRGLRFMAIGIDLKALTLSATVQSSSPAAAEQFAELLPELLKRIVLNLPQPYQKACQAIFDAYRPRLQTEIKGDQILFSLKPDENRADAAAEFATLLEQVLPTLLAKEVKPRLRELALGLHNYESAYRSFPPAKQFRKPDGSSGLSWRVHILPFIEENELYQQFKLDEPWDSPHNLPLLNKMPDIYQTGSWKLPGKSKPVAEGHTTLVGPAGEGTMFGGKEALTMGKVVDGTSNTIMLVVVKDENAVPWTAPQDYSFDAANPAAGLAVDAAGNFMAAMGDGSVQEIRADLPAKTILNLFQMNDGNVVIWK